MVHYNGVFIEYPTVDMYTRSGYSPPNSTMFNAPSTAAPTTVAPAYDASYNNTVAPVDTSATYYEQHYSRNYYQHSIKEDPSIASYQHAGWNPSVPYQTNLDSVDPIYKQHTEYFNSHQPNVHNLSQQPSHYTTCAVMSAGNQNMLPHQQVMDEDMAKDRQNQNQSYAGWISGAVTSNCKTRTKDKYRVVYSDHQRLELEKEFHYSRYITIRRKAELAVTLNLSERQVKIWFQNRRAKERKVNKKKGGDDSKFGTDTESRGTPTLSESAEAKPQDIISQGMSAKVDPNTHNTQGAIVP